MFYFDTSFIIPLLLPEETSDRIEHFFSPASRWRRTGGQSVDTGGVR